ncbi:hypothetical protein RJ639_036627 [Escallonia herrerae]|uniref:Uncharacterized protein n=1 Tax=Escallonia herrerae TaxID=1293975 RepID=A0AA88WQL6_9ASTE|nr:hypothetical protein RJ639_036627 [Escallonia herrerae]
MFWTVEEGTVGSGFVGWGLAVEEVVVTVVVDLGCLLCVGSMDVLGSEAAKLRIGNDKEMMQSFISSTDASYLQGRSCARGHVGLAVPIAIACLRIFCIKCREIMAEGESLGGGIEVDGRDKVGGQDAADDAGSNGALW